MRGPSLVEWSRGSYENNLFANDSRKLDFTLQTRDVLFENGYFSHITIFKKREHFSVLKKLCLAFMEDKMVSHAVKFPHCFLLTPKGPVNSHICLYRTLAARSLLCQTVCLPTMNCYTKINPRGFHRTFLGNYKQMSVHNSRLNWKLSRECPTINLPVPFLPFLSDSIIMGAFHPHQPYLAKS